VAVFWLLVGATALAITGVKLLEPSFFDTRIFSYTRLRAVASLSLIYGWLLQSGLAALFYVLPRVVGARIRSEPAGQLALLAINGAVGLGVVATLFLGISGHEFLELPRLLGLLLAGGLGLVALVVFGTAMSREESGLFASVWYLIGGAIWAPLAIAAASLPAFAGVRDSIAHLFSLNALLLASLSAIGIGCLYYLIPRATGSPLYSQRLAIVGFWWLAISAPLAGQSRQIFGPGQDWLETLAIAASIGLLVPVVTLVVNLFGTLQGAWGKVPDHPSLRFAIGGTVVWVAAVLWGMVQGFRSVAQITGATEWITGQMWLLALALTLWFAATITYSFPRLMGRRWFSRAQITGHFWLTAIGAGLIAIGALGSGLASGSLSHASGVAGGPLFLGTNANLLTAAVRPYRALSLLGILVFAIGQWIFAGNLFRSTGRGDPHPIEVIAPSEVRG
jgi:cytochrome c oxidase cbb3-type subunit 1